MERTKARRAVIRAFKPSLGECEGDALREAVSSGWLGTGIYTRLFESALSRDVGGRSVLATNSGTAALHLALAAMRVEGGEVLTTPVTSVATSHAILYNRAFPVFCDVDPETGNIDPGAIEASVTRRTRAIVVVHLGHACDMDRILEIAKARRLLVLEDVCACHAVGGSYNGRPLGTMGDAACFSFGRFKGLTTLDGGAVACARAEWTERMVRLRRMGHGERDGRMAEGEGGVEELGFHYRMNDLAAVLGLSQLRRRGEIQERLDEILRIYADGLSGVSFLRAPKAEAYSRGVRAYAAYRVLGGRRDALRRHLADRGIEVNDVLFPNHRYALYRRHRRKLPAADRFCAEMLHLPFYPGLSDGDADRVVDTIRKFRG